LKNITDTFHDFEHADLFKIPAMVVLVLSFRFDYQHVSFPTTKTAYVIGISSIRERRNIYERFDRSVSAGRLRYAARVDC